MKKVLMIAGEASGDLHAANLIEELKKQDEPLYFYGIGGDKMKAAGVELIVHNKTLSALGAFELIAHLKYIYQTLNKMRRLIANDKPDLLILIDFPDFNLRLAKTAKQNNVKVLYYISPQLWAWRKSRVNIIKNCVDKMAVILPFEVDFYKKHGVEAFYVGNPLAKKVIPSLSIPEAREKFKIYPDKITIGLLAGSRTNEIKYILPTILKSAVLLKKKYPNIQFVLPLAATLSQDLLQPYLQKYNLPIKVIPNEIYNVIQLCDAVISVSGTVTLEIALLGIPMVVIYRLAILSSIIAFLLIHVEHISLANIIAEKTIAKEFVQYKANPKNISNEIIKILEDKKYNQWIREEFRIMKNKMLNEKNIYPIENIVSECLSHSPSR